MKKLLFAFAFLIAFVPAFAQDGDDAEEVKEGWSNFGKFSLLFSQAAFNDKWMSGGTSNYAGDLGIDYNVNYKKDRFTWDNNFVGQYGLTKIKGEGFNRKTNDKLELHSVAGYQIKEGSRWSYSFFLDFNTQFAKGYNYIDADPEAGTPLTRVEHTNFMSPGYLKFGPGILYKNEEILKVNFAPATARFIFVDKKFTNYPGYQDGDYFGVDFNKTSRFEFGASLDASSELQILDNVALKQKLSLFSNYLEKPGNVDIDYELRLDMKINEFLSANFIFQAIYDDNAIGAFQIREGIGVGFSYNL